jgi:hypothetical protein
MIIASRMNDYFAAGDINVGFTPYWDEETFVGALSMRVPH